MQSYIFVTFQQITFKLGIVPQDFEVFSAGRHIFANWSMSQVKNPKRVYLTPQKEAQPTGTPPDQRPARPAHQSTSHSTVKKELISVFFKKKAISTRVFIAGFSCHVIIPLASFLRAVDIVVLKSQCLALIFYQSLGGRTLPSVDDVTLISSNGKAGFFFFSGLSFDKL